MHQAAVYTIDAMKGQVSSYSPSRTINLLIIQINHKMINKIRMSRRSVFQRAVPQILLYFLQQIYVWVISRFAGLFSQQQTLSLSSGLFNTFLIEEVAAHFRGLGLHSSESLIFLPVVVYLSQFEEIVLPGFDYWDELLCAHDWGGAMDYFGKLNIDQFSRFHYFILLI